MRPKMGRIRQLRTSLLTSTKKMTPGLWFRPTAAMPSRRAQSSISFLLHASVGQRLLPLGVYQPLIVTVLPITPRELSLAAFQNKCSLPFW